MADARRKARVLCHGEFAGMLSELDDGRYQFVYDTGYLARENSRAVSLTLPLRLEPYESPHLFAFFHGLLAEGSTRELQARQLRIDEDDGFGLLVATGRDLVGAVTVEAA